ncbi:MAG: hypothetical protein F6K30_25985 [Cyanothece sp. SIO2G6]|nr:hypothetical protein [Cyanothece sp. SIO2G6]
MKKYRFLTPAILEVEAAANFYEANRPELGREFLDEVDETIQRIVQNPRAWKILEGQIRRYQMYLDKLRRIVWVRRWKAIAFL